MRLTHEQRVEAAIPLLTRKEAMALLTGTKGHRKGSDVGVALEILRGAVGLCLRIGRLKPEQIVPLPAPKVRKEKA